MVQSFQIGVPQIELDQLLWRVKTARWPKSVDDAGWGDGVSLEFMRQLARYWTTQFNWRAQERRLNRLPHFLTELDGHEVHFLHQKAVGPSPMPLVLTHGWPGSFLEMEQIIPLLADPAAHGGDPTDAFDVIVPSLPGYGFSAAPERPGVSARAIAGLWNGLMSKLGYDRYGAQGGDIGAGVSMWLARDYSERVTGAHLNYIPGSFLPSTAETPPTPVEQSFLKQAAQFSAGEGAYAALQSTKPQTLSFALSDSPLGLAAWIAEKFYAWSDHDGKLEDAISLDALLTDVSLYWFSDNLGASLRLYKENRLQPLHFAAGEIVSVPLGVALFPRELPLPPRSWVERVFKVERWTSMSRGGHFAALEQPQLLVDEIRAFFRPLRG